MLIERTSAPVMAASSRRARHGAVAIVGQLHLRRSGWVVMNETLPWRPRAHDADDGTVALSSAAPAARDRRVQDIAAASHLHLAVERARAGGSQPTVSPGLLLGAGDVADDPAAKGAGPAPAASPGARRAAAPAGGGGEWATADGAARIRGRGRRAGRGRSRRIGNQRSVRRRSASTPSIGSAGRRQSPQRAIPWDGEHGRVGAAW
jgi:hypothetical protein